MWNGPIHDPEFAARVLTHVEAHMDKYGTAARMQGMLTVAKEVGLARLLHLTLGNRSDLILLSHLVLCPCL